MRPASPVARLGLLLTLLGLCGVMISAVAALPDLRHPPESAQHKAAVVKYEAEKRVRDQAEMAALLARIAAGESLEDPPCEEQDAECFAIAHMEATGREGVPVEIAFDDEAAWSIASYASASGRALREFVRHPRESPLEPLPTYGFVVLALGVFLWVMYDRSVGKLINWVRHGSAVPVGRTEPQVVAQAPRSVQGAGAQPKPLPNQIKVPWYRTSAANSAFIICGIISKGYLPLVLITCVLLLTGDIYYKDVDQEGNRRTWSRANKAAAVLLLVANVGFLAYSLTLG